MSWVWALVGGLGWSASEYAIHRFIGHGPRRTMPAKLLQRLTPSGFVAAFNAEHMAHHADPTYFAASSHKVGAASVALPVMGLALAPLLGARSAAAFTLGFGVMYGAYELAHRRIHTHAPTGPYSRWMRRHHLYHHHKTPRQNHGVTSALWDHAFSTYQPHERVRVPRQAAPVWMVDRDSGRIHPRFEADYELVGPGAAAAPPASPAPRSPRMSGHDLTLG